MTDTYIEALERIADKLSDICAVLTVTGILVSAGVIMMAILFVKEWWD